MAAVKRGRRLGPLLSWIVIGLVIVGASIFYFRWRAAHAAASVKYRTTKAAKGDVVAKVTATGTLSARITVLVGAQVSGRILELHADWNSPVTKGQVIAKIDPALFDASVKKAKAEYAQGAAGVAKARANANLAAKQLERDKALHDQGLLGQADLDTAETAVTAANADIQVAASNLEQADADLNQANVNLGFTTIVSPIDGVVISRAVDVGQTVASSLQSPTLFTIAQDLHAIQVDTFVSEADVGKLKAGMDATFTVDAYPGEKFKGKVREVRNAATTVQNVVTYDAVLDVVNDELKLKPGMTANVTFIYSEKDGVLKVPNSAFRFHPAGTQATPAGKDGSRTLYVLHGQKPDPVVVKTGLSDGSVTEIVGGDLEEGADVITDAIAISDTPTATAAGKSPLSPGGGGGGGRPPR